MTTTAEVQKLLDIHEIHGLKARYFRTVDMQDWEGYENVFTPDGVLEVLRPNGEVYVRISGASTIASNVRDILRGVKSVHQGYNPEIEITGRDTATGIWAMEDQLVWSDKAFHGWGHYHERYQRTEAGWRIALCRLHRLDLNQAYEVPRPEKAA